MKTQQEMGYSLPHDELKSRAEGIKASYLTMLGVFLMAGENQNENQKYHFQGLISGAQYNKTAQDILTDAENIEISDYEKFIEAFSKDQLKYRWCFDSMTLSWLGEWSDEQMSFLADLMEELELSVEDVVYIKKQSKALLEKDIKQYIENELQRPISIAEECIRTYAESSIGGSVLNTKDKLIIRMNKKTSVEGDWNPLWHGKEEVELENIHFNGDMPQFESSSSVYLKNCVFDRGRHTMKFLSKHITIEQCYFKDFNTCVLEFTEPQEVHITGSTFKQCNCVDVNISDVCTIIRRVGMTEYPLRNCIIDGCAFEWCNVKINVPFGSVNGIISNGSWSIKNSKFISCNSYYQLERSTENYEKSQRSSLFTSGKYAYENVELYDSARLG